MSTALAFHAPETLSGALIESNLRALMLMDSWSVRPPYIEKTRTLDDARLSGRVGSIVPLLTDSWVRHAAPM